MAEARLVRSGANGANGGSEGDKGSGNGRRDSQVRDLALGGDNYIDSSVCMQRKTSGVV